MLTSKRLKEVLTYDAETGVFQWATRISQRVRSGDIAGSPHRGYLRIKIDGRIYAAHRLAHVYMTGEWPTHDIDHRNLNRADNRWSNLRPATRSQNCANRRVRRTSSIPVKGVHRSGQKFYAAICKDGRQRYLGTFDTAEAASQAYAAASKALFGDFGRVA